MSKSPAKIAKTTNVTGYFNSNDYRISIRSAAIGVNVTLEKGEFVKDRQGNKINDPRLDAFLRTPGGLAKELGDPCEIRVLSNEVPTGVGVSAAPIKPQPMPVKRNVTPVTQMVRLPSHALITDRPVPPRNALPGPTGSPGFKGGPIKDPVFRPGVTPTGISNSVRAMSVADAERYGIIARANRPVEGLKIEGDTIGAKNAPFIDEMIRPERPAQVARPSNRGPNVRITTPVGRELPEPVLEEEIAPAEAEEQPLLEAPSDAVIVDPEKPYMCSVDGKAYKNYTSLYRHAKSKYPDQLEEIMNPYKTQVNAAPGE